MSIESEEDENALYYMYAFFTLAECVFRMITLYIIGFFMEKDETSFFLIIFYPSRSDLCCGSDPETFLYN